MKKMYIMLLLFIYCLCNIRCTEYTDLYFHKKCFTENTHIVSNNNIYLNCNIYIDSSSLYSKINGLYFIINDFDNKDILFEKFIPYKNKYHYSNYQYISNNRQLNSLRILATNNSNFYLYVSNNKNTKLNNIFCIIECICVNSGIEPLKIIYKTNKLNVFLCASYVQGICTIFINNNPKALSINTDYMLKYLEDKLNINNKTIEEITDYMLMSDKNTETQTTKSIPEHSLTTNDTNQTTTKTEALEGDKDTVCSTPPQVNEEQKKDGGIWKKCCCWFKNKFTKSSQQ